MLLRNLYRVQWLTCSGYFKGFGFTAEDKSCGVCMDPIASCIEWEEEISCTALCGNARNVIVVQRTKNLRT